VVADGNAVRVSPKIFDYLAGITQWFFGIHDVIGK
jgi:hypothetical protein